ncbi:hypothetical protein Tco_0822098 [Tanacetum coccineum]|uniref:Uncharacterized protein n=1 Tax=Tanacetum coccineum TaxID=301880 RepID=A0ABQ5AIK1_9ASTR
MKRLRGLMKISISIGSTEMKSDHGINENRNEMLKVLTEFIGGNLMVFGSTQMIKDMYSHPYAGRKEVSLEKGSTEAELKIEVRILKEENTKALS